MEDNHLRGSARCSERPINSKQGAARSFERFYSLYEDVKDFRSVARASVAERNNDAIKMRATGEATQLANRLAFSRRSTSASTASFSFLIDERPVAFVTASPPYTLSVAGVEKIAVALRGRTHSCK